MNPDFDIPAQYFYALAAKLPSGLGAGERFTLATRRTEWQLYQQFVAAIGEGTIEADAGGVTPMQAARRIAALGALADATASYTVAPADGVYELLEQQAPAESWLNDNTIPAPNATGTAAADEQMWAALLAGAPVTANQTAQLRLAVCALTGWDGPQLTNFITELATYLGQQQSGHKKLATVDDLAALEEAEWVGFFTHNAELLPPFTQPVGTQVAVEERIAAFLRFLRRFYDVAPSNAEPPGPVAGELCRLDRYGFDPLQSFLEKYNAANPAYVFGETAPSGAAVQAAIAAVFPAAPDGEAAAWLAQALEVLHDLCEVTSTLIPTAAPNAKALQFAIVEALFARGFTSKASIAALAESAFAQALTGSVAFQWAAPIWQAAGGVAKPPPPPPGGFQPINPDGDLANCIPPWERSPLGPVAYLHELLQLGPDSTCEEPWTNGVTFGQLLGPRRGDLGALHATRSDLEVPIPVIDLVDECLEFLAAQVAASAAGSVNGVGGVVYDTGATEDGGHALRAPGSPPSAATPFEHDPATMFAALPEHATPAMPVAEPGAYAALASDFSAPALPYSQPLDVSRSYLRALGTTRLETMRRLRAEITEFVLREPGAGDPPGFDPTVWRYPLRSDIAPEYLHIGPDELRLLYQTPIVLTPPAPAPGPQPGPLLLWQLYGFPAATLPGPWEDVALVLSEFLARTGLSYCEFIELWKSKYVPFHRGGNDEEPDFDECPPCYLDKVLIAFPAGTDVDEALMKLAVFIRLWRTLRHVPGACYGFTELADVADVLGLFHGAQINPDFIAELVAFSILREELELPLGIIHTAGATGAARTRLLGLWAQPQVGAAWDWAVHELLGRLAIRAAAEHGGERRAPEFIKVLAANLDPLSGLVGFDPAVPTDIWHATPTRTLRFVELLTKLYASAFTVGDLVFLFTTEPHLDGDDPFGLPTAEDALDDPLALPDESHEGSLWALRRALLDVEIDDARLAGWTWWRIDAALRDEFGYAPQGGADPLASLAQHAFPHVFESHGNPVPAAARQYRTALPVAQTSPAMWNADPESPFRYDPNTGGGELWVELPLSDEAVLAALARLRQLTAAEAGAVRELYFQPRADLAGLAFLFGDLARADREVLQGHDEEERWSAFRRGFALAHARCRLIAEHLARHVPDTYGEPHVPDTHDKPHSPGAHEAPHMPGAREESHVPSAHEEPHVRGAREESHVPSAHEEPHVRGAREEPHVRGAREEQQTPSAREERRVRRAWRVLRALLADENFATAPWEGGQPAGTPPATTWATPGGGAFAALLGLCGTGLRGEYTPDGAAPAWRELCGSLDLWGRWRNRWSAPLPTLIPDLELPSPAGAPVEVRNGVAFADDGERLGGAQGFAVRFDGVLLVEAPGRHRFCAGAPTAEGEHPEVHEAERQRWRVRLRRGQREWVLLSHGWPGQPDSAHTTELELRRGAYEIVIELERPAPDFTPDDEHRRVHAGFEVKYAGPDTGERLVALPHERLFVADKHDTLDAGLAAGLGASPTQALRARYASSLRDIRRTYQRAFKALLLTERFELDATPGRDGESELGYLLGNPERFVGTAFYRGPGAGAFAPHRAQLDLNFLPLLDNYRPPSATQDERVDPSPERRAALMDWWERLFDYTRLREQNSRPRDGAAHPRERALWRLFAGAAQANPNDPAQLLPHLDVPLDHTALVTRLQGLQTLLGKPQLTEGDLRDERWPVRIWRAARWAAEVDRRCLNTGIGQARPDLWVQADPSAAPLPGNGDLARFVQDALIENGEPRRYTDLRVLDDGLRERARHALSAFLCALQRVQLPGGTHASCSRELSGLLLLDVDAGIAERASRIEDAVSAVQAFVQRARLRLEPGVALGHAFLELWDGRFASFRAWQACKRRELYPEDWIAWEEIEHARRHEGFRFLEENVRERALSIPAPAGIQFWARQALPAHVDLELLQVHEPSTLHQPIPPALTPPAAAVPREDFGLLGAPEHAARPSWLATIALETPAPVREAPIEEGRKSRAAKAAAAVQAAAPAKAVTPPGAAAAAAPAKTATRRSQAAASTEASAQAVASAAASVAQPPKPPSGHFPLWIEAAIRLGTRFLRVAAAGEPVGASRQRPRQAAEDCCCCADCGRVHPPCIDEYYFWLAPARYYDLPYAGGEPDPNLGDHPQDGDLYSASSASANASYRSSWEDPKSYPKLLAWESEPMVHLFWCRLHNGELGQLRRSGEGVALERQQPAAPTDPPGPPTLELLGRVQDSLVFAVDGATIPAFDGGVAANGGYADWRGPFPKWPDEPGWRYDICRDDAVLLPLLSAIPLPELMPGQTSFGGLAAYPFFVYFRPGASLSPLSWFAPAVTIADALLMHCRFEEALRWYELAHDPFDRDNTWDVCPNRKQLPPQASTAVAPADGECCQSTPPTPAVSRRRAIALETLETLLRWGDATMAEHGDCGGESGNAPEAFALARVIFDAAERILGRMPRTVLIAPPPNPPAVSAFTPLAPPLNPRLLSLYERVGDRLRLIHEHDNGRRLRLGASPAFFGQDPARDGWRALEECCCDADAWCEPTSPYRFSFLAARALELTGEVRAFGAALLAAIEKGDAEYLASLRATHEHQLTELTLRVRRDQWRDADWQVQALAQAKLSAQSQLAYYTGLLAAGLSSGEQAYQSLTEAALALQITSQALSLAGEAGSFVPDVFVGTSDFIQLPMTGRKLTDFFNMGASAAGALAQDSQTDAGLNLTEAGWARRAAEWQHQIDLLGIQIEEVERQILGGERRADAALRDLNNTQRQREQTGEVEDFLRDKFSGLALYLWQQRHTAALYRELYELAVQTARQAERAYNYERGFTAERFVGGELWDDLHDGLLAGERLDVAVRRMQKSYLDRNRRERELTKHISLRLDLPERYLQLRESGSCEIELPEWLFDLDYPGQYMRRIKNVTLSIPCVVGPYTGVHCRLTLLASSTRVDPRLIEPPSDCCDRCRDCCEGDGHGYLPRPADPRIVRQYLALEGIATSSGQGDSGMFTVDFRDERYLPFEFAGAVSRWRLELPSETNFFDRETITDVVLHMNYTAREGGDALRQAAGRLAQCHIPGDGLRVLDVRHELPAALRRCEDRPWELELRFDRRLFPYLPGHRELFVNGLQILFHAPDAVPGSHHVLRLTPDGHEVRCVASEHWPGLFHGFLAPDVLADRDRRLDPDRPVDLGRLVFPEQVEQLGRVFLLCAYDAPERRDCCEDCRAGARRTHN